MICVMPDLQVPIIAIFGARAVAAAVMTLLMLALHRNFRKDYLLHWAWAWLSLALYAASTAVGIALEIQHHLAVSHPARLATALLSGVAGNLQMVWLFFGCYELIRRRPTKIRASRLALTGAIVLGVVTALGGQLRTTGPEDLIDLTSSGPRTILYAIVFIAGSIYLLKIRGHKERLGFLLLSLAFALWGAQQIHYVVATALHLLPDVAVPYATLLGFFDLILQSVMIVAMMACLLQDQNEASELATVEIEHLAYHDALTGLPNRPLFIDRLIVALAQANRANQTLAVFFLDLDRFKDINDSLGHNIGDQLLRAVAERVRRSVREGDTIARFGGDEFTLLIPRVERIEDAATIAQKIIEMLKIPFVIGQNELFVTTSIGISLFPNDGADPETLVRNADTAMYRAKEHGRDNYQLYAPAMNARALERLALENLLRKALNQNELILHYQPLIDLKSRTVAGVEALVRWNHPDMGLLYPAHFITVAELSGLIVPIGNWVLRTACKQVRHWQKKFGYEISVSVNLSARQFQQPDLLAQVAQVLEETGLPPHSLELEITESSAMQNSENTIYTLREFKALGVRIAMDDFGTGYSSLNYLKRFPIDTLKLDKSFVNDITTDPSDAAIATAVISLAHSLNLDVVAEGVETEAQLAILTREKCDRIQGYYFSKPRSIQELEAYVAEHGAIIAR
jgi:diguanylate cyclase (GGDEF)-like protein